MKYIIVALLVGAIGVCSGYTLRGHLEYERMLQGQTWLEEDGLALFQIKIPDDCEYLTGFMAYYVTKDNILKYITCRK